MTPETQAAGTQSAATARTKAAEERQSLKRRLEQMPLTTPEEVRDYLAVALRATATGALEPRAGAACASLGSRLIASFGVSYTKELKQLRADREEWQRTQHQTGVTRHRR